MERREVCWRGRSWQTLCERITGSRFVCHDAGVFDRDSKAEDFDTNTPSDLTLDGVPCESFSIKAEYDCVELNVELSGTLALIEFSPHQKFAARPGDTSYEVALARAAAEYPVNVAEIRETATYWVFPVFQIGCCGILLEKAAGKVVEFGSYTGLDDWIWGYEQGLLDEPPRDLVVVSVRDPEVTLRALKQFLRRPGIALLPATFENCAGWRAIKPLREAGDAFAWRCESRRR